MAVNQATGRYAAIAPKAWLSEEGVFQAMPTCTVTEEETAPQAIGILDATGTPLYRLPDRVPIGFIRSRSEIPTPTRVTS